MKKIMSTADLDSKKTRGLRSFFVVHPDWISEAVKPAKSEGRTNLPWPWEFSGARDAYRVPYDYFRKRVGSEIQIEDRYRSLSARDPHYNVKYSSPLHVNNPKIVHDSNPLSHRPFNQPHTLPYNNHRQLLTRELSLPPIEDRFASGDIAKLMGRQESRATSRSASVENSRCNTAAPPSSPIRHEGPNPEKYMYREGSFNLGQRQPSYMSSRTSAPVFGPSESSTDLRRMHSNYMTYDNWNN